MSTSWRFTPFRVGLLYVCGTAMGIGIGTLVMYGPHWGPLLSTLSMGLTSVAVAAGAYRGKVPAAGPPHHRTDSQYRP